MHSGELGFYIIIGAITCTFLRMSACVPALLQKSFCVKKPSSSQEAATIFFWEKASDKQMQS